MIVGYARAVSGDQHTGGQREVLIATGAENIFTDTMTGPGAARPELEKMLKSLQRGDIVVVTNYARLANSLRDLLEIVDQFQARGVGFRFLEEDIDTTDPQGWMVFNVFAGLARFERKRMARRTREGLAKARERGTRMGRPPALSPAQKAVVKQMRDVQHWPVPEIANVFNVSARTIRRVE